MNRPKHHLLRILVPLILFILGCPAAQPPGEFMGEPPGQAASGITLLGETAYLAPGSQGSLLLQARSPYNQEIQADARVKVLLNRPGAAQQVLFTGKTDKQGLLQANFAVPAVDTVADPNQVLTVVADTNNQGQFQLQQQVYVGRVYNVLISTDKPVYQPGQTIHLRGLALDSTALKAAQAQTMTLTVADPSGNKLLQKALVTSVYGIASADFTLDSQATSGDYLLTASMGPVSSSHSVEVKPYTLPRFKVAFASAKPFYLPGEEVSGTVSARYFFGKPVAGGQVTIKGFATDVERVQLFEISGVTDDQGNYAYTFAVPNYFVGRLQNNAADVDLEIAVADTANHAEQIDESITVAEKAILMDVVPESGSLRPGLENILYLHTATPDGRDLPATVQVSSNVLSNTVSIKTDDYGLGVLRLTPTPGRIVQLTLNASTADGQTVNHVVMLDTSGDTAALLLRPEKAQYHIGETLNLDIHVAGHATTAYLDIVKGHQTFGLAALPIKAGLAQAALDIDGSLLGTLELNAYVITDRGEIVRDRRLVLVNPAPADVQVQTDAAVYHPGDTAKVDITVHHAGKPMQGAIGVSIVDESVFAVGAQDPGFARTYFLLERELQEPRYEIHDFIDLGADDPSPYDRNQQSGNVSNHTSVARRTAQQTALFGYFAQELAGIERPAHTQPVTALPKSKIRNPQSALAWGWGNRLGFVLPLVGLAFYDGTRRRRHLLIGLVLLSLASFFYLACAPAAMPAGAPAAQQAAPAAAAAPAAENAVASETTATHGQAAPPRLRQFFPETLYWLPELTTDANGHAQVDVPIADSITTWRVSVLASDQDGNLGSAEVGMRVFQDFFVEPDLPRFLTVGDELDVPVSIFNYLEQPQTIQLSVQPADWFTATQTLSTTVVVSPNQVAAVYIPIRVTHFGQHEFKLTATGSQLSDAVVRQVEILPDGKAQATSQSGRLTADQEFSITTPAQVVPGTGQVTIKIYPGVVSQVLDGLESMLRQPNGCFEQTSSSTYPNVLVLDYLKSTGQINPRIQLQAEQYINLGYQRLLGFEVRRTPGGFSLFGEPPAQTMLTAYGLMEFGDMSKVSYVDPALIERTANFLFRRQQFDGSWEPRGMTIESGLEQMGASKLLPTAYVVWALADAGYANSEPVQRGVAYLQQQLATLRPTQSTGNQQNSPLSTPPTRLDPYAVALLANALIAANPQGASGSINELLDQLLTSAQQDANGYFTWSSGATTYLGGSGAVSGLETSAMTAIALLRTGQHLDVAQSIVDYLITQRDNGGMFYTTQTTVVVLKALLLAAKSGGEDGEATLTLTLDGARSQTLTVNAENSATVQQVSFDDLTSGAHKLHVTANGKRALQYQVVTSYYVPWAAVPAAATTDDAVRIHVDYDRTTLTVNDTVNVRAEVELRTPGQAGTILVDLGIPPGFGPVTADLDGLVQQGLIQRYELTGRQIILYMTNVPSGQIYTFPYRLQARFPIKAQTPSSQAYDYYTPERQETVAPQRITVTLGTPPEQ